MICPKLHLNLGFYIAINGHRTSCTLSKIASFVENAQKRDCAPLNRIETRFKMRYSRSFWHFCVRLVLSFCTTLYSQPATCCKCDFLIAKLQKTKSAVFIVWIIYIGTVNDNKNKKSPRWVLGATFVPPLLLEISQIIIGLLNAHRQAGESFYWRKLNFRWGLFRRLFPKKP